MKAHIKLGRILGIEVGVIRLLQTRLALEM